MGKLSANSCLVVICIGLVVAAVLGYLIVKRGVECLRFILSLLEPRADENGDKTTAPAHEIVQVADVWYIWEVFDAETS